MPEMKKRKRGLGELFKASGRFFKGCVRSIYSPSKFSIKAGYLHRVTAKPHDDSSFKEEFQKEVYQKAASMMKEFGLTSVVDIGCGSGFKLIKYLGEYQTLGVDSSPVIDQVMKEYSRHSWLNISNFNPSEHEADLIICADVIEHVDNPEELLKAISSIKKWKFLLISTPERDMKRGWYHFGPPPNPAHYREWNLKEFQKMLFKFFLIKSHEVINIEQATQLVICYR